LSDVRIPFEPYHGDNPYIFISYAHLDAYLVFPELKRLHDLKYRLWYDVKIEPGNEWSEEISDAIDRCSYFIVFISPRSVDRLMIRKEILYALDHNKPVLPVYLEPTTLPGNISFLINHLQGINKFDSPNTRYYRQLELALPAYLQGPVQNPEGSQLQDTGKIPTSLVSFHDSYTRCYLPLLPVAENSRHVADKILTKIHLIKNSVLLLSIFVVILAWMNLFFQWNDVRIFFLEFIVVLAMVIGITYVILGGLKSQWLNEITRAERYKFFQFRQFLNPLYNEKFQEGREKIRNQTLYTMEQWLNGEDLDEMPDFAPVSKDFPGIIDFISFYLNERLVPEINRTTSEISTLKRISGIVSLLPGLAFICILLFVSLIVYYDISQIATPEMAIYSGLKYIFIIALLGLTYSIIIAVTYLVFGSKEVIRDYLAMATSKKGSLGNTEHYLRTLSLKLVNSDSTPQMGFLDPGKELNRQVFQVIQESEDILVINFRHWLRLKMEMRWFV
jgi:hypothetical protein